MMSSTTGNGGFYLPTIYEKAQKHIERCLELADIDYAELTRWSFADEFLCFILQVELLQFVDSTYPNPRVKNEVPIWFLITCQFLMHLHQTGKYSHLNYLLNSGSILTRFGFNVGAKTIGFNDKQKNPRHTAVNYDTVRKFFKDTDCQEIRDWYLKDLQNWFKAKRAFDSKGIFLLDQTHLVVPDNPRYEGAAKMPVDEHGQLYDKLGLLTQDQKKSLVYHRCYALTTLLNISFTKDTYHVAGYELGPGNEDELVQADRLVPDFCNCFPGLIKDLIVDRGYVSGDFIGKLKHDHRVNVLIPLRTNMDTYREAVDIAMMKNQWQIIAHEKTDSGKTLSKMESAIVDDIDLWSTANFKPQTIVTKCTEWDFSASAYNERYFVLCSTKRYSDPSMAIARYQLRTQIEERFRQFKRNWYICEFPSPHASMIESHVCFTLFTYNLLQLYLRRKDLQDKTNRMISTLRNDERLGKDAVLVYSKNKYGVFDLDDCLIRVAGMEENPRQKLKAIMEGQKEARLKRND